MTTHFSRRALLKTVGAAALAVPARVTTAATIDAQAREEGTETPKICLEAGAAMNGSAAEAAAAARRIRQLGVTHVISGGNRIPWDEAALRATMDRLKSNGLTLANLMIVG